MTHDLSTSHLAIDRIPWNKGKLIGAKPPLRLKHIWAIRSRLQLAGRKRDLALFNLAIDSKLRGCDLVSLRLSDIAPRGYAVDRATIRQHKTGRPVRFELTEQTREAVDDYLRWCQPKPEDTCSQAACMMAHISRRANMQGSCATGLAISALIQRFMARIPCVGPRRP